MWILWRVLGAFVILAVVYFLDLHSNGSAYRIMWDKAVAVENYGQLHRTWRVYMRPKFLFWWFRDVKIIKRNTEVHRNKLWGRWNWGSFWIFIGSSFAKLYYRCKGNNWITRRIVDHVRICDDGTIIGKFHIRVFGRLLWLAWFTMEKV